ncbi:phosphopyruvate hydratase [Candidatus Peregrinibacteria bacterium RIFOXYA2_FULL_33_7]|nr:MAG: phosphopyruvate hydratase [Candidatus Peregrinibacteria bacterium RIFOXYA2_FULL_33_7]
MPKIKHIHAREILDSRGNPTLEVEVYTDKNMGRAAVPSGASTGIHEANELRDNDKKRYSGKGVLKAVSNVNKILNKELRNFDVLKQEKLDKKMIEIDGTANKSKLGANAILGVSLANAVVASKEKKLEFYEYLNKDAKLLPVPMMNIMNGGQHADSGLDIQEFMIVPVGAGSFKEALRMGAEIFHSLKSILKDNKLQTSVGDEGGFAPNLPNNEKAFEFILEAIKKAGYKASKDVMLAIDAAASEFYDKKKKVYNIKVKGKKKELNSVQLTDFYDGLVSEYPIFSIEDSHNEDDFEGWSYMNKKLGDKIQIVGDDLFVTNVKRLEKGIDLNSANAILIKLNQIGTLTETIEAIMTANKAGWNSIVSHRSGETEDTIITDFVVSMETGQIKTGSLCRTERVCKYNRLLRIEEKLGKKAVYMGKKIVK